MTFVNNFITIGLYIFIIATQYQYCLTQDEELYSGSICHLPSGTLGICKPFSNCQWIRDELKSGRIRRNNLIRYRCSFEGAIEIVCCGDETPVSVPGGNRICNDADDICFDNPYFYPFRQTNNGLTNPTVTPVVTVRPTPSRITNPIVGPVNGGGVRPTVVSTAQPPVPVPTSRTGGRPSEIACANYTLFSRPVITFHILNGKEADLGEFPHMAALGYQGDQGIEWRCGASLISERYLLTAAHCASSRVPQPVVARLGKIKLESTVADDGVLIDIMIQSITLHPSYGSNRNYHDIALVRLQASVPFDENVHPACLRTDVADPPASQALIITGWGRIDANRDISSSTLLKTNLTVVPVSECTTFYANERRRLPTGLNEGHFCAYDPAGLSDACQGDSGGPLQIVLDNEMSVIVGITSFGYSCGSSIPAVYARVAFYLDWIEKIVWP